MKLTAKIASVLSILGLSVALSTSVGANTSDNRIAERIKPLGNICIEGDESCGMAVVAAVAGGARSGEDVYNASCTVCHAIGVAGAPKFGSSEWVERGAKGMEALLATSITGINAMPARGTCTTCSDDDLQAAIQYMLDSVN